MNSETPSANEPVSPPVGGAVTGSVRIWLRLEALAVLSAAVLLYHLGNHSWLLFVILFFSPDLSFLGYIAGPRIGAIAYNIFHSYLLPVLLGCALLFAGRSLEVSLIWTAHIGFDRLMGYGLKYPSAFADTHLGRLGKRGVETRTP